MTASLLLLLSTSAASTLEPIRLEPREDRPRAFVDASGRERIFHGTNAIVKGPPWLPDSRSFSHDVSMAAEDFAWMQRMGLNVLRLGVMWPGLEPVRGQYNASYLDELERIAELAATYGVYTLLDMHQDGLSEHFCGEGIPTWAVRPATGGRLSLSRPFPEPFDSLKEPDDFYNETRLAGAPRLPTRAACKSHNLGPGHMESTEATALAYGALYANWDGVGEAWAAAWAQVAARFADQPHVLGLELFNEPFAGDFYHNPAIMAPSPNPWNADKLNLQPAYDNISKAVRAVSPDALIFFAGVTWDDEGSGFTAPPGGAAEANRSVLAYHYYSINLSPSEDLGVMTRSARKLGTASFLTETSNPGTHGADKFAIPGGVGDQADALLQSWAGFEWKSFCREEAAGPSNVSQFGVFGACKTGYGADSFTGDGGLAPTPSVQRDATRTYATAIAGRAISMRYNGSSAAFTLVYNATGLASNISTEIFVWPARYPGGAVVAATASDGSAMLIDYNGAGNRIQVRASSELAVGTQVVVTVGKKVQHVVEAS